MTQGTAMFMCTYNSLCQSGERSYSPAGGLCFTPEGD